MEPGEIHQALKILVTPPTRVDTDNGLDASFIGNIKEVVRYLHALIISGRPVCDLLHHVDKNVYLPCKLDELILDVSSDDDTADVHHVEEDGEITTNGDNLGSIPMNSSQNSENRKHTSNRFMDTSFEKDDQGVRWDYVKCILKLLLCLKLSVQSLVENFKSEVGSQKVVTNPEHAAPPLSPEILSFEQQKIIMTSLQFAACLGICPNLIRGVGIPVECRSEFGNLLGGTAKPNLSIAEREFRMWTCVTVLLDCVQQPTLGALILNRHLNDILAALLQICHAPRQINRSPKDVDLTTGNKCDQLTSQNRSVSRRNHPELSSSNLDHDDARSWKCFSKEQIRIAAHVKLNGFITKIYQPALVKELLVLQGGTTLSVCSQQLTSPKRPPNWLCRTCSLLLTDCLLRHHGVLNVLRAILETSNLSADNFDWRKCDAAAQILSAIPPESNPEDYYRTIGPQIVALLSNKDKLMMVVYLRVASKVISNLYDAKQQLAEKYILNKILEPFYRCVRDGKHDPISEPIIFVTESELQYSVDCIHKLVVIGIDPDNNIIKILDCCIDVLLHMYAFCRSGISYLRQIVEDIVISFLKYCDTQKAVSVLRCFILNDSSSDLPPNTLNRRLTFAAGDHGGVMVLLTPNDNRIVLLDDGWEKLSLTTVQLLKLVASDKLIAEFFLSCLTRLTEIVSVEVKSDISRHNGQLAEEDDGMMHLSSSLTVLDILSKMSDTLGYGCLIKNTTHILDFVKITLERCVQVLDNTEDVSMGMFESETVTMAMGLLAAMTGGEVQMTTADYEHCQNLLPLLHQVVSNHPDPFMQQLAMDLQVTIATHGHLRTDTSSAKDLLELEHKQNSVKTGEYRYETSDARGKDKHLIDVMDNKDDNALNHLLKHSLSVEPSNEKQPESHDVNVESNNNFEIPSDTDNPNQSKHMNQSLEQVLQDLHDPMIPVKGHALVALRRMILNRDQDVMQKHEEVLKIFQEHLGHPDTYIYLAAIQGLTALGSLNTDYVIKVLVEEYVQEHNVTVRPAELRMKIGEVLVKTIRTLGEMAPKYRDILIGAFLQMAKDPDHHIRASSLSNLAEICVLLHYSLGKSIHEIMNCVGSLTRSDPEVEVRRAAAMFVHKLLEGLGADGLKILADSIKDLYHQLKMTLTSEKDSVVIQHVQLALEALDTIMRDFIFPSVKLEKKIHVMSAPSD